jgi:hypothetical protein
MIIAMAISAIVIMGTYSLFNTIFKAHSATSENLFYTGIYNGLSNLINDDFINMIELEEDQLKRIDNETDENDNEDNGLVETSSNDSISSLDNTNRDNATNNEIDNKTKQNYIILNKQNNYPKLIFSTYNSLFFNKALPVIVTYYIDDENYFVRVEENNNLSFKKEMRLIGNVENFQVESFDGEDFIDDIADSKLMRFIFNIDGRTYQISVGKFILDEK